MTAAGAAAAAATGANRPRLRRYRLTSTVSVSPLWAPLAGALSFLAALIFPPPKREKFLGEIPVFSPTRPAVPFFPAERARLSGRLSFFTWNLVMLVIRNQPRRSAKK